MKNEEEKRPKNGLRTLFLLIFIFLIFYNVFRIFNGNLEGSIVNFHDNSESPSSLSSIEQEKISYKTPLAKPKAVSKNKIDIRGRMDFYFSRVSYGIDS